MNTCPICGYDKLERPPFENIANFSTTQLDELTPPYEESIGKASYEECPVCKFEPGADDNPGTTAPVSFSQYREQWKQSRPKLES